MTSLKKALSFLYTIVLFLLMVVRGEAQINLHTDDLPRFYQAFDSVMTTRDTTQQTTFIQTLYVEKASQGLKEFMVLRGGSTAKWRAFIEKEKTTFLEKRPWILSVLKQETEIRKRIAVFKRIYPNFRDGDIYFCVGINNSGGTIDNQTVYIGTEVAANSQPNWAVPLVMHEFVHTQQWTQRNKDRILQSAPEEKQYTETHKQLLGKCIEEGMADFIAELVYEQSLAVVNPGGHTAFGLKHEQMIWDAFQKEMYTEFDWKGGWLYGRREIAGQPVRNLGYFVGYKICKHYYHRARDKPAAIRYMIELNLTDENAKRFLSTSGYELAKKVSNQHQKSFFKESRYMNAP